MTKEQYKERLDTLREEFEHDKRALMREYAFANNPYKIGDVVSDSCETIVINKMLVYYDESCPSCVYTGPRLTKSGKPFKNGDTGSVYQLSMQKSIIK